MRIASGSHCWLLDAARVPSDVFQSLWDVLPELPNHDPRAQKTSPEPETLAQMAAMRNSWDGWGWMVIDGDGDTLRFDSIHLISNKCHWIFFTLTLMRRLRSMMRPRSSTSSKFPIKLFESALCWQRRPWKFKLFKNHVNGEVLIANYCNTSTKWPNTSKCAPNQPSPANPAMDLRVLPLLWYQGAPPLWQFCGRWMWNREGERVASRRLFQASAFFTSSNLHWRTIFDILSYSLILFGSWLLAWLFLVIWSIWMWNNGWVWSSKFQPFLSISAKSTTSTSSMQRPRRRSLRSLGRNLHHSPRLRLGQGRTFAWTWG